MIFNWSGFTCFDFVNYCSMMENGMIDKDYYVGNVRAGDLCLDLIIRQPNDNLKMTGDLYIGGIDNGYGYSESGYPYSDSDVYITFEDTCIWMTYDDFKEKLESMLEKEIINANLLEKANKLLNLW